MPHRRASLPPLALGLGLLAVAPLAASPAPPAGPAARLVGVWELKADDGRSGTLTIRGDGTLTAASAAGESPLPEYHGRWAVLAADGDRYRLEFARGPAAADAYQVTLVLTSADAFTLVETVRGGTRVRDAQRFVRAAPIRIHLSRPPGYNPPRPVPSARRPAAWSARFASSSACSSSA
jgi:hypothetical protein